jgi:2-iminobutanoate/2-iminopropanoate deaminase
MTLPCPTAASLLPYAAFITLCLLSAVGAGAGDLRRSTNAAFPDLPFSAAVELGDLVYVSGALGTLPGSSSLADGIPSQVKQTLDNLEAALAKLGLDRSRIVEMRVYLPDVRNFPAVNEEIGKRFGKEAPTMTVVEGALALPGAEVEIAVVAARAGVEIKNVKVEGWPEPVAHFRRALAVGDSLFVSGQVGYDPQKRETPAGTAAQARLAFANIRKLVEAAGFAMENIASCRVFLADARDFSQLNEVWKEPFPDAPPVRETLQGKMTDPEFRIEIHCHAIKGERRAIEPSGQKPAAQPYSTAIAAGGKLYTSGMVARGADGWVEGGIRAQTRAVLAKLKAALEAAGAGPGDVADATVVLAHPSYYQAMNEEYRQFFPSGFPSRITVVQPLMAAEGLVEISFIARLPAPSPAQ